MEAKKYITFEEFKVWTEHLVKQMPIHKPAPETLEKINKLNEDLKGDVSEINSCIKVLGSHFEDSGIVPRIEEKVTQINGRVKSLEIWKACILGGMSVILFLFPVVSAIFVYFIKDLREDMENRITSQIETNNNKYFEE
jgi:hypothetical protein